MGGGSQEGLISLCNEGWLDLLPASYYDYLSPSTSDHAPMLIHMICKSNIGHKLFKFFNYWLQCEGFDDLLAQSWSLQVHGVPMHGVLWLPFSEHK